MFVVYMLRGKLQSVLSTLVGKPVVFGTVLLVLPFLHPSLLQSADKLAVCGFNFVHEKCQLVLLVLFVMLVMYINALVV